MSAATSSLPAVGDDIVDAIRTVVGAGPVALHEPRFAGNEWAYLKECLDSTYVSSVGKFVDRFEAELAELHRREARRSRGQWHRGAARRASLGRECSAGDEVSFRR